MKKFRFASVIMLILFVILLVGCELSDNGDELGENEIKVQATKGSLTGKDYNFVVTNFEDWGFINVEVQPIYDIIWGITAPGTTKDISINGNNRFSKGDIYENDVPVIITYSMPIEDDPKNKEFNITWQNEDGTVLKVEKYKYGSTPAFDGKDPMKESTLELSYVFTGWIPNIEVVTNNIVYTAIYEEVENEIFTLSFESNPRGSLIGSGSYYSNNSVTVKAESENYMFQGWYDKGELVSKSNPYTFIMPSNNIVLKARFCTIAELQTGDTYYFGTYPQSRVLEPNLLSSLSGEIGALPSSENHNGWTPFNYYSGSKISDFQWYMDITYNNLKYRAIYFDKYRERITTSTSHLPRYSSQYSNGYLVNEVYWFSFDLIEWKVLSNSEGNLQLIVNTILDSQHYYFTSESHKGDKWGYFSANDYRASDLREWLNTDFYNIAFDTSEKSEILTTLVDNSQGKSYNEMLNTNDKVYLLSIEDIINEDFGFQALHYTEDMKRMLKGSDYALSQGLSISPNGNSFWWLRTPRDVTFGVYAINQNGRTANFDQNTPTYQTHYGVVPVITIKNYINEVSFYYEK